MSMLDCSNKEALKVLNLGRDHILIYLYQNVRRMQREDCLAEMYWWGVDFYFIKPWWQHACICVQL